MTESQKSTKRWLSQLRFIRAEIAELTEAKQEAWDSATKITADLTGMPGTPSKNPHSKLDRFAELDGNLSGLLEQKAKAIESVVAVIEEVQDPKLRTLLTARYINCKQWDEVAITLGYRTTIQESDIVFQLHRRALDAVEEIRKKHILT